LQWNSRRQLPRNEHEECAPFFVLSICLAISASYELLEWLPATMTGAAANDFIGSQGDVWDTQADMLMALTGAVCALVFFSHLHNRALRKLERVEGAVP
jgi:putative membrane protein